MEENKQKLFSQTPVRYTESPRDDVLDNIRLRDILYGQRPTDSMSTDEYTNYITNMTKERRSRAEEIMKAQLKSMGIEIKP